MLIVKANLTLIYLRLKILNQWNSSIICSNENSFKWDQSQYSTINRFLDLKKKKVPA